MWVAVTCRGLDDVGEAGVMRVFVVCACLGTERAGASGWGCRDVVALLRGLCPKPPTLLPDWGPRDGPEGSRHLSDWRLLRDPLTILSR